MKEEDIINTLKEQIRLLEKELEQQIKYGTRITLTGDECIPNVIDIIKKDYISKDKIKQLKDFIITDCTQNNIDLIPLSNLIKNINILLEGDE